MVVSILADLGQIIPLIPFTSYSDAMAAVAQSVPARDSTIVSGLCRRLESRAVSAVILVPISVPDCNMPSAIE